MSDLKRCIVLLALLAGCGAAIEPVTCPQWEDLRLWQITGSAHALEFDNCHRATTARLRGPGEIQALRDATGTLGAQVHADCTGYVLYLGTVPFHGRAGELYTSAALLSPASARLTVPASCWASLRLDFTP